MGKVMGVLPSTLKSKALWVYFQMYSPLTTTSLAEGLLQAGMKFVAVAGMQGSRDSRRAEQQRRQHRIRASAAGEHQVFVEGRLQRARIGDAQHCPGGLDVVGDAQARLRLVGVRQAVVKILSQPQVEEPVAGLDLVFDVKSQFLHVGVPGVAVKPPPRVRS